MVILADTGNRALSHPQLVITPALANIAEYCALNSIEMVIPGPEQPLVAGITNELKSKGIRCFGPDRYAAQLEGSKAFSKDFMVQHNIPTAQFKVFTDFDAAKQYVHALGGECVIKASGLAAGKGVLLPETIDEAIIGLEDIMVKKVFGDAGAQVVIEEKLIGQEVSILAFCDGYSFACMPAAQDHKRLLDGDKGLNTGGMGAYCPAPIYTPALSEFVHEQIIKPTLRGMRQRGHPFVGVLYTGLMLTPKGPKVLEYNCRFGDPETQAILPLMDDKCDLADIMVACCDGYLDTVPVLFKKLSSCTVVGASAGYPAAYKVNVPIELPAFPANVSCFYAGTTLDANGRLVSNGGRVLAVTSIAETLKEAIETSNHHISKIKFEGMHYRTDIGYRALALVGQGATYADAGVNINNGNLLVEKIKPFVKATKRSGADADLGGFGGLFDLKAAGYVDPILVSGTDGVGTKLKIAHDIGKHDTIGIDLVAMSVNDVLVQGAEPLFFLDYFATSKLDVNDAADVVKGIARGCLESGCALVGGETAEMPGMYAPGDYDLAGFVVGAVERDSVLPKLDQIIQGDVLIGLPSSGIHSNGFSLARHVVKMSGLDFTSPCPFETATPITLGEALLTPTVLYVKPLLPIIRKDLIKSMVHITGGGFLDNVPRSMPSTKSVEIDASTWPLLPVFSWIKSVGKVADSNYI